MIRENLKIRNKHIGAGPMSTQNQQGHTLKNVENRCYATQKGITLIALIITIIILLILAGATISLTLGENGIFKVAERAATEHTYAQLKEELELEILNIRTRKTAEGKEFKREDLLELANIGATIDSTEIPAEGEYKNYFFEIDENYAVKIIGKVKGEKPTITGEVITTGIVAQGGKVEIKVTAGTTEGTITSIDAINGATLKTNTSETEKIFEVSANGTYYFKAIADNGRSATVAITVNTIIESSTIKVKDETYEGFTILVTDNYEEGLVTEYKYYIDGTLVNEGTTNKEYVVTGLRAETNYQNIYVEAYFTGISTPVKSNIVEAKTTQVVSHSINLKELLSSGKMEITKGNVDDNGVLMLYAGSSWDDAMAYLTIDENLLDYSKLSVTFSYTPGYTYRYRII